MTEKKLRKYSFISINQILKKKNAIKFLFLRLCGNVTLGLTIKSWGAFYQVLTRLQKVFQTPSRKHMLENFF